MSLPNFGYLLGSILLVTSKKSSVVVVLRIIKVYVTNAIIVDNPASIIMSPELIMVLFATYNAITIHDNIKKTCFNGKIAIKLFFSKKYPYIDEAIALTIGDNATKANCPLFAENIVSGTRIDNSNIVIFNLENELQATKTVRPITITLKVSGIILKHNIAAGIVAAT